MSETDNSDIEIFQYVLIGVCLIIIVPLLWSLIIYGATLVFVNYYFKSMYAEYYSCIESGNLYIFDYDFLLYICDVMMMISILLLIATLLGFLWIVMWFSMAVIDKEKVKESKLEIGDPEELFYISNIVFISSILLSIIVGSILFGILCAINGLPVSLDYGGFFILPLILNFSIILFLGICIIFPIVAIILLLKCTNII